MTAIAMMKLPPGPPIQGTASALTPPAEFVARLAEAEAAGVQDAISFAETHDASEKQLITDWAIRRLPYAPKSDAADLKELHAIAKSRTPEGIDRARFWASHGLDSEWERLLGQYTSKVGPRQALAARKLLEDALSLTNTATQISKASNARLRPFVVDTTLKLVVDKPGNNPSFPSGHTSAAFAAGLVLAHLMPDRAGEFMGLAQEASWARLYSGVHFPTDVVGGVRLATTVVSYLNRVSGTMPLTGTAGINGGVTGARRLLPGAVVLQGTSLPSAA